MEFSSIIQVPVWEVQNVRSRGQFCFQIQSPPVALWLVDTGWSFLPLRLDWSTNFYLSKILFWQKKHTCWGHILFINLFEITYFIRFTVRVRVNKYLTVIITHEQMLVTIEAEYIKYGQLDLDSIPPLDNVCCSGDHLVCRASCTKCPSPTSYCHPNP